MTEWLQKTISWQVYLSGSNSFGHTLAEPRTTEGTFNYTPREQLWSRSNWVIKDICGGHKQGGAVLGTRQHTFSTSESQRALQTVQHPCQRVLGTSCQETRPVPSRPQLIIVQRITASMQSCSPWLRPGLLLLLLTLWPYLYFPAHPRGRRTTLVPLIHAEAHGWWQ